ncbi:type IV pilin protein [Halomonadaceae bacterium KBTZ08]
MWNRGRSNGFTLIELMIVVAIIGILAAIAYPSYLKYVEDARRSDAQAALMGLASAMERHRTSNNTYTGAGSPDTGAPSIYPDEVPKDGSPKFYDLTISAVDATSYTLRATPKNAQSGDGVLELDHTGTRWWDKNNNGSVDAGENDWE